VDRPVAVACINTALSPVALSGYVAVECPKTPPPEVPKAQEAQVLAVAASVAAAAGLSHLASNRREWLALPLLPIVARIKRAADDPVRREIVQIIEKMGPPPFRRYSRPPAGGGAPCSGISTCWSGGQG
jgi:hypothetical protein